MALQLTIACGDYDRTHPLIDGSIKPEGIELNWLVLPHLEIWTRMALIVDSQRTKNTPATVRAEDFVDMSFVKELDDSGYIDRLYGGR